MGEPKECRLVALLCEPDPDLRKIIDAFVIRFNAAYGMSGSERWDLTKEDWQRYEFLGDRVLNLIVAQHLFTLRNPVMDGREMSGIAGEIASERVLSVILQQSGGECLARLIPDVLCGQETTGDGVMYGAFEALLGALYCEYGLDEVVSLVTGIMNTPLKTGGTSRGGSGFSGKFSGTGNNPSFK